jgi:hypothetical protein
VKEVVALVNEREGYRRIGVYTFKAVEAAFEEYQTGHFGAETGSNHFDGLDCLHVVGTPLPSLLDVQNIAKMVFFQRMEPFSAEWSPGAARYVWHGDTWNERVGNFWEDEDLQAVVWQMREARIIQAAERARLNTREVDVWLWTNIPIAAFPADHLTSVQGLVRAPSNVSPYRWLAFVRMGTGLCRRYERLHGPLYRNVTCHHLLDLHEAMGLSHRTIREYWRHAERRFLSWQLTVRDERCQPFGRLPYVIDFTRPLPSD